MTSRTKTPQKVDPTALAAFRVQAIASVMNTAIRWGSAVAVVYIGVYLPINALAGNETFADIAIEFLADFRINTALAWALGGGGMAYGLRERRLRQRNIERLEGHIRKLETKEDRRRSSSRLTKQGRTNPGDEL